MGIIIKTQKEIEHLHEAGVRVARVVRDTAVLLKPGITTRELDTFAEEMIRAMGDVPAFLNFTPEGAKKPYPATLCTSRNNEIVHGIPNDEPLRDGDIVSIDCGLRHNGVFVDHAVTVAVGNVSAEIQQLIDDTNIAMNLGIQQAMTGNTTGDIGYAIESFVNDRYGIVRVMSGHGVGRYIHEEPYVPNYGLPGKGVRLVENMVIAIEPMLTLGTDNVIFKKDGYTVTTKDHSLSAHFEHTVWISPTGPKILTQL